MRCPDCNKFVSYDDSSEPEANLEIKERTVTGTVRVVLPCAECGTELKEYTFDVEIDVEGLPEAHVCHIAAVPGCPEHVAGTPCPVCKWDGVPKKTAYQLIELKRCDEPTPLWKLTGEESGPGEGVASFLNQEAIAFVRYSMYSMTTTKYFMAGEEAQLEKLLAQFGEQIPSRKPGSPASDEQDSYEVEVDSVELTSRSDCGTNRKTGKPNKFNPRYATTYYGFDLTGTVKCSCKQVEVEFTASDETAASGMDELT